MSIFLCVRQEQSENDLLKGPTQLALEVVNQDPAEHLFVGLVQSDQLLVRTGTHDRDDFLFVRTRTLHSVSQGLCVLLCVEVGRINDRRSRSLQQNKPSLVQVAAKFYKHLEKCRLNFTKHGKFFLEPTWLSSSNINSFH